MNGNKCSRDLLGDAYTASSLLQKAIRRGEPELALLAAAKLLPRRGKSIWRRLLAIAFEDVGAANIDIVASVLELTEGHLKDTKQAPSKGLHNAVVMLAESPKSRAADHLICSARSSLLAKSTRERAQMSDLPVTLAIAGDPSQPLIKRMAVTIDACGRNERAARAIQSERLGALRSVLPEQAHVAIDLSLRGYRVLRDGIALPLPFLVSALTELDRSSSVSDQEMPETAYLQEVPTWVWDKHTSLGKRAFGRLLKESDPIRRCLSHYVASEHHLSALCMAGFYFDAAPVHRRLDWTGSMELELAGKTADMRKVGCPPCGIEPLMEVVTNNSDHLNTIRIKLAGGRAA